MAYEQNLNCITLVASGAVPQYGVVYMHTDGTVRVTPLAGTSLFIVGVAQNVAASGEPVTIAFGGVTKVLAGATITPGTEVAVGTADGSVITRAAATATKATVGLCIEGATLGKWATVLLGIGRSLGV